MRNKPLILAVLLFLAACGGAGGPAATTSTTTPAPATSTTVPTTATLAPSDDGFPVTVTAANGEVTIEERPDRIVSLSPTGTEMLFAVGAGDQVVAVDSLSYHPEQAPVTDLSAFEPNLEAISSYQPDLVVVSDDINQVVPGLEAVGVTVIHHPAAVDLEDTYEQIEQLGVATGNAMEAAELIAGMRAEIDRLVASVPPLEEPLSFYHELDPTFYSVTSGTFVGQFYSLVGLVNIADEADGSGIAYPQLSAEHIIAADPDLIFLADTKCCGETPETVAARPGWDQIAAVRRGAVIPVDDDIASRWGPRVVDFLAVVVEAVVATQAPGS